SQTDFQHGGRTVKNAARSFFGRTGSARVTIAWCPMSLDTSTLYFIATMIAAMLGVMLLVFGKNENIPALKWWGTAYLLGAASVALWSLASNMLGEVVSLALNAVGFVACGMWVTGFSVELVLYAVGTVFVIFMMVSERAVIAHKNAASMDPLTGMFNRRGFSEISSRLIEREANAGRPMTAMIFDIDHFKSINDRFGHPAGDEILKLFATVVVNTLRISDLSGRIGGEEFAALLPCPLAEGVVAAERVREAFANSGIVVEDGPVDTTVSIGVAGGP